MPFREYLSCRVRWVVRRCARITFLRIHQRFLFHRTGNEKTCILSTCRGSTLHKAALKLITSKPFPPATVQNNSNLSVGERERVKTAIWGLDPNLKASFSKGNCPHRPRTYALVFSRLFPTRHTGESKNTSVEMRTWRISLYFLPPPHPTPQVPGRGLHPFDTGFSVALTVFQEGFSETGLCYCISKAWDKLLSISKVTECLRRLCMIKLRLYYLFGMIKMFHLHEGMCSRQMIFTECSNTVMLTHWLK